MPLEINVLPEVPAGAELLAQLVTAGPQEGFLAASGFRGRAGEVRLLPGLVVAGLGGAVDSRSLRRAIAAIARTTSGFEHVTIPLPEGASVQAAAEAFLLGGYRFTTHKSHAEHSATRRLDLVCADPDPSAVDRARRYAEAVCLTRDLVNEPGGLLTPAELARRIALIPGLTCEVWDEERIVAERLGGLIGVNRGSAQPARLVRLEYTPDSPQATIALVGKGITFDSGGLSIKTQQGMQHMKVDMAGAATVAGVMSVLPALSCPVRVVGWLPLTDNMSGGDAMRIGDVLRTRSGKTVEVLNTDAEGRLVLADGLALAAEEDPDAIIDLATLTIAVSLAVGRRYIAVGGNDADLMDRIAAAARRTDELTLLMPSDGVDKGRLESKVADLVNAPGERFGQSVIATHFLGEFVPAGIPWAHMDLAASAYAEEDDGEWTPGGTGSGVRTLLELLTNADSAIARRDRAA